MAADRLDDLKDTMQAGFASLHIRFDNLNGRVREAEQEIAILKDRSNREKTTASKWGSVSGALGGLVGGFFSGWMGGR
jgi:hypothetical protein